ncbi:MAG: hypothetical protein KBF71_00925 [Alphaproteobacteria bacterium]|nr:hypothetical protein [Alphaproteobacteria bacterium]
MSGIFKIQNTGFAAQAFKAIVLNPQRQISHLPIRRCGGLLTVATHNLQARQGHLASKPFTPLIQKSSIADGGLTLVAGGLGLYYLMRGKSEKREKDEVLQKVITDLDVFRLVCSEKEQIAYSDSLLKAIEPYFADSYMLKGMSLKAYVKKNSSIRSEAELSRHIIDETVTALRHTKHIISIFKQFDEQFLDSIAIGLRLSRYPKCSEGYSLLAAMQPK